MKNIPPEVQRVMNLPFDDLLSECQPIPEGTVEYLKELVKDVEVDLDAPLDE